MFGEYFNVYGWEFLLNIAQDLYDVLIQKGVSIFTHLYAPDLVFESEGFGRKFIHDFLHGLKAHDFLLELNALVAWAKYAIGTAC